MVSARRGLVLEKAAHIALQDEKIAALERALADLKRAVEARSTP